MNEYTLSKNLSASDIRSPTAAATAINSPGKTKGVKLVSPSTEKELLPQELCYCLGFGHLRGVKELEDFASRREKCRDCRGPA